MTSAPSTPASTPAVEASSKAQAVPPPVGSCVRLERSSDGLLVTLVLEPPHRKQTVFDAALMRDLDLALETLERDTTARGLVLRGREALHFCYGADVDAIAAVESARQAEELARGGQRVFQRLHRLSRGGGGRLISVAAVGGPVPGGAFEVSLACDWIVLADDPRSRIGLPEVKLGILPGWGGCQRLPRRVGVPKALAAILTGTLYDARRAKKLGLVDRLAKPEYLFRVAEAIARGTERLIRPGRGAALTLIDRNPLALALIAKQARQGVLRETKGRYPAPMRAIELVVAAPRTTLERGLANEAAALGALADGPECRALVSIFKTSEEVKKLGQAPGGGKSAPFKRAAVVGAGIMGGGIASLLAQRGVPTRLKDLAQVALDQAVRDHQAHLYRSLSRRRIEPPDYASALDRLEVTQGDLGFGRVDVVIEAVSEVLAVKQKVLAAMARICHPEAVLCTNTSSLSVDLIAAGLPHPERVVGMHFFNPVRQMPLVEVVRGPRTDEGHLRRVVQLALDLGKTPVIVSDAAGFVVNRLLGPYIDEALRLFCAGAGPQELDRIAREFGLPMGPCALLDEVGLDIAAHTAASLEAAFGARMTPCPVLAPLVSAGELGKKTGRGIYLHEKPRRSPFMPLALLAPTRTQNPRLRRPAGASTVSPLGENDLLDRLLLPMINEAMRLLAEGVVARPADLDLATVFGMGFPPFRGGLLAYADSLGPREVLRRLERCRSQADVAERGAGATRFEPAPLLLDLERQNRRFRG
jgi:3-hydroxyacyl-CoA dehydrogenase / enoyl-CoA hydratase / 3-hydroxybutyryl-CoA epimerase